jgi:hypothetical protein
MSLKERDVRKEEEESIRRQYKARRDRQLLAISFAVILLLFLTLIYRRPDLLGEMRKDAIVSGQVFVIVGFFVYSFLNWRCPSCGRYMGNDIFRRTCKRCRCRYW